MVKPSLQLGSGNWATKTGALLGYTEHDSGVFSPQDFTVTRNSSKTVTGRTGLIETVSNNVASIDFKDNVNGALLLEPTRSNYVLLSNDFSGLSGGFVTPNYGTSPQGLSVSRVLFTDVNEVLSGATSLGTGVVCNFSAYVKGVQGELIEFAAGGVDVLHTFSGEWERLSGSKTSVNNSWNFNTYGVATARDFLICGAQLEEGSYATSYIPTAGAISTRLADTASKTGISSLIGQTEGTMFLYADIQKFNDSSFYIAISNGTLANAIYMWQPSSGILEIQKRNAGVDAGLNITTGNWSVGFQKVAIVYTTTSLKVFINGVQKGSNSFSGLPPFTKFSLGSRPDQAGALVPKTEYKQVKLYNTALTDAELIALTTL